MAQNNAQVRSLPRTSIAVEKGSPSWENSIGQNHSWAATQNEQNVMNTSVQRRSKICTHERVRIASGMWVGASCGVSNGGLHAVLSDGSLGLACGLSAVA